MGQHAYGIVMCVYLPASNTIYPTLLYVSRLVWSCVLWSCFDNCIKSPPSDPLVCHSLGNLEMWSWRPWGHPRVSTSTLAHFQQHPLSGETCACMHAMLEDYSWCAKIQITFQWSLNCIPVGALPLVYARNVVSEQRPWPGVAMALSNTVLEMWL